MINKVSCVIMAGGKSSRMGTDKSWVNIQDKPMINHVIDKISPQVDEIIINTNSNDKKYDELGYNIYPDVIPDFVGPLSGVLVGLKKCRNDLLLSIPVDCPLIPDDLVNKLINQINDNVDVVVASSNGRNHPVIALWQTRLCGKLEQQLKNGVRKVDLFTKNLYIENVDFENSNYDVFTNVNTKHDIDEINRILNG